MDLLFLDLLLHWVSSSNTIKSQQRLEIKPEGSNYKKTTSRKGNSNIFLSQAILLKCKGNLPSSALLRFHATNRLEPASFREYSFSVTSTFHAKAQIRQV